MDYEAWKDDNLNQDAAATPPALFVARYVYSHSL